MILSGPPLLLGFSSSVVYTISGCSIFVFNSSNIICVSSFKNLPLKKSYQLDKIGPVNHL